MSDEHGHSHAHESHGPPDPPEPKTPTWLTALGGVLFLIAGLWLAVGSREKPSPSADTVSADAGASASAVTGSGAGDSGVTPEQAAQVQKMMQQLGR